jgi:UDP-glucose:(heptosyl)LPS alpha-1,3-glucosyltransferase
VDAGRFRPENRDFRRSIRGRYGLSEGEFVFAFIANNPRLKGFDTLVKACGRMKGQPFRILFIGSDAPWAKAEARRKGLSRTFVFGDHAEDIEKILPACDCLVHPAYYDACSRVVIEALSSGIPVITTHTNGAAMYVNPSVGRVIPPGDPEALSRAMQEMLREGPGAVKPGSVANKGHDETFREIMQVLEEVKPG